MATFFLYETVDGFNEKYVITTIETKSIQDYPFPAVTFYPGDYNSKNAFLRDFLNDFEFSRFDWGNSLKDNDKFLDLYQWLLSTMNDELFDDIHQFLIDNFEEYRKDDNFYIITKTNLRYSQNYTKEFKEEVCQLMILQNQNISLKAEIKGIFMSNMYKGHSA